MVPFVLAILALGSVSEARVVGWAKDWGLKEASGLVHSKRHDDILWTHNDSGDYARVFALRASDGLVVAEYAVAGAGAADWEDLALDPSGNICAGDIGSSRNHLTVYCFPEPYASATDVSKRYGTVSATAHHLRYPDGAVHDAETLIIEPNTNTFAVLTKGGEAGSILYTAASPAPWATTELQRRHVVPLWGGWAGAVGGDISWNGAKVVVKSYGSSFYLFDRSAFFEGGSPYVVGTEYDPAESVAFAPGSESTVYTLSEGPDPPLRKYDL